MPRSAISPAGKVLGFFQAMELPMAELVLGLAQDALRARQQRSLEAKARVKKPAAPAFSARPAAPQKRAAKKRAKKSVAKATAAQA